MPLKGSIFVNDCEKLDKQHLRPNLKGLSDKVTYSKHGIIVRCDI